MNTKTIQGNLSKDLAVAWTSMAVGVALLESITGVPFEENKDDYKEIMEQIEAEYYIGKRTVEELKNEMPKM